MLDDKSVHIVVNLTNPENHADVTRAAIAAGKHVYSEKPLAMTMAEAKRSKISAFGIEYEGKTGLSTSNFSWAA